MNDLFREQKPCGEVEIAAGGAHGDAKAVRPPAPVDDVTDSDLKRFLDGQGILPTLHMTGAHAVHVRTAGAGDRIGFFRVCQDRILQFFAIVSETTECRCMRQVSVHQHMGALGATVAVPDRHRAETDPSRNVSGSLQASA
jgi:hypothetical protein